MSSPVALKATKYGGVGSPCSSPADALSDDFETGSQACGELSPTSHKCRSKRVSFNPGGAIDIDEDALQEWPPDYGFMLVVDGWCGNPQAKDWMYKPATGVYFHMPTETLWRRASGNRQRFLRVEAAGLESALSAFGASPAADRALLRKCLLAWHLQPRKFDEMDRALAGTCSEGETPLQGPPRRSAPRAPPRRDAPWDVPETLRPAAEQLQRFLHGLNSPSKRSKGSQSTSSPTSDPAGSASVLSRSSSQSSSQSETSSCSSLSSASPKRAFSKHGRACRHAEPASAARR